MNAILFDENGLLRSGWRAAIFLFAYVFSSVVLGGAVRAIFLAAGGDVGAGSAPFWLVISLASLIPAIVIGWMCGKLFEKLPFRALGVAFTQGWLSNLLLGLLIGTMTLTIAVIIGYLPGGSGFSPSSESAVEILSSTVKALVVFAAAAAFEEALFRGYMLQTLTRAGYAWLAIAITSIFFGAVHAGNPNANIISTANTVLAGVWFGLAYLKTRDLWFVWGLHLMWNWMQGSVFGIEVSGLRGITGASVLIERDAGPAWLTGLEYGLEGGIACTVALIISMVAIWLLPVGRSSRADLGGLDLERNIDGPRRMGQLADGDKVDSRLGV